MQHSLIFDYPFLLFLLSFFTLGFSAWFGAAVLGRRRDPDEKIHDDYGTILAATLTLLGLIIGFSFSMAISRYDQRKNLEEEEANAIGTAYVRADLLPAPDAARLRTLLKQYVDVRIEFYDTTQVELHPDITRRRAKLQVDLWSTMVGPAAAQPTAVMALALKGMNDVLNAQGYTQAAWWNRIPHAAWLLMLFIAICSNMLIGYGTQQTKASRRLLFVTPLVVSISLMLIADIDSPRGGLIHVNPQNLKSLADGALAIAMSTSIPTDVDAVLALLDGHDYVADRRLATSVFLALKMGRPLFLEGEAGVGKTEIAKVLSAALGRKLVRLQCYEGLDVASAVYEWNYPRQMIEIRLAESAGNVDRTALSHDIFTERFLLKRPLLEALSPDDGVAPVLLIDELDRTDEPFEAYLLEVLAEYQITIPELGPIRAAAPPVVIITSNRTREIHDAIKRRCLYHWVGFPDALRELAIVRRKCPQAPESLARAIVAFTQRLRTMDLFKAPGIAETLDWAEALVALDRVALDPQTVADTAGVLLKYQDDIGALTPEVAARLVAEAHEEGIRL